MENGNAKYEYTIEVEVDSKEIHCLLCQGVQCLTSIDVLIVDIHEWTHRFQLQRLRPHF